jgi:hypothetical protein
MIEVNTKGWAVDAFGWSIAPTGLSWVHAGSRVTLGNYVRLGDRVMLGDDVTLGNRVTLGNGVRLGNDVTLGDGVRLGGYVKLGDDVRLGDYATVRRGEAIADIGCADGYRKCLSQLDGVAYVSAGCRDFTLAQALKHWDVPTRRDTFALLQSAVALAANRGLRHE